MPLSLYVSATVYFRLPHSNPSDLAPHHLQIATFPSPPPPLRPAPKPRFDRTTNPSSRTPGNAFKPRPHLPLHILHPACLPLHLLPPPHAPPSALVASALPQTQTSHSSARINHNLPLDPRPRRPLPRRGPRVGRPPPRRRRLSERKVQRNVRAGVGRQRVPRAALPGCDPGGAAEREGVKR